MQATLKGLHFPKWLIIVAVIAVLAGIIVPLFTVMGGSGTSGTAVSGTETSTSAPASAPAVSAIGEGTERTTLPSTSQETRLVEFKKPNKVPLPQIEDPAEMAATAIWMMLIILNRNDYPWAQEFLDGSTRNAQLAGVASTKFTVRASAAFGEVAQNAVVEKLEATQFLIEIPKDVVVPISVSLSYKDQVYGDKGRLPLVVYVKAAERGFWGITKIDLSPQ